MLIVFHHIPKSGGTSVVNSLKHRFPHHRVTFNETEGRVWGNNGLFSSHHAFRDYSGPGLFITWIRNPVDMFYSAWRYYTQSGRPHPQYQPEKTAQFIKDKLRGCHTIREYVDRCLADDDPAMFPRGLFDLHWDRFDFVGVTEEMDQSMKRLGDLSGARFKPRHVNKTGSDNSYRRDEVANMLEREVAIYEGQRAHIEGREAVTD